SFPALLMVLSPEGIRAGEKPLSVYFIGNSLTASTTLDRVHGLFQQRGIDLQFGSQLSGGKSLIRHLNYKKEPDQKWVAWETSRPEGETFAPDTNYHTTDPATWRFGRYDTALANHKWDVVVMQPFVGAPLHDELEAVTAFMALALKQNPDAKFYIYQVWPRRPRAAGSGQSPNDGVAQDIDYPTVWDTPYAVSVDDASKAAGQNTGNRSFFLRLREEAAKKFPNLKHPIRLIPVGEVLYALDALIKADALPGLKDLVARDPAKVPGWDAGKGLTLGVNMVYADPVHFNPMPHNAGVLGNLISGTTIFTVLSGESPLGLSAGGYQFDDGKDAALVKAIQELIWKVVTSDPLSGVTS
ncbi:MAG: hypothetical protein WEB60_12830, partial [Terrimicrobiaceae bacterium]